jgi:hypothetical protein
LGGIEPWRCYSAELRDLLDKSLPFHIKHSDLTFFAGILRKQCLSSIEIWFCKVPFTPALASVLLPKNGKSHLEWHLASPKVARFFRVDSASIFQVQVVPCNGTECIRGICLHTFACKGLRNLRLCCSPHVVIPNDWKRYSGLC